jgi:hypothetical protein
MFKKIFKGFCCSHDPQNIEETQEEKCCQEDFQNKVVKKQPLINDEIESYRTGCIEDEFTETESFKAIAEEPIEIDDGDTYLVPDEKLIRPDEKEESNLKFTKKGIADFFEYLQNLHGFEPLHTKENLIMHCRRSGSPFSKNFYLGRLQYKIDKSKLNKKASLQQIRDLVFSYLFRCTTKKLYLIGILI